MAQYEENETARQKLLTCAHEFATCYDTPFRHSPICKGENFFVGHKILSKPLAQRAVKQWSSWVQDSEGIFAAVAEIELSSFISCFRYPHSGQRHPWVHVHYSLDCRKQENEITLTKPCGLRVARDWSRYLMGYMNITFKWNWQFDFSAGLYMTTVMSSLNISWFTG